MFNYLRDNWRRSLGRIDHDVVDQSAQQLDGFTRRTFALPESFMDFCNLAPVALRRNGMHGYRVGVEASTTAAAPQQTGQKPLRPAPVMVVLAAALGTLSLHGIPNVLLDDAQLWRFLTKL